MKDKSTICDISITGFPHNSKPGPVITYKASIKESRGLELAEPMIVMRIEHDGKTSAWVDADQVSRTVKNERQRLIDIMDTDFIPNQEEQA